MNKCQIYTSAQTAFDACHAHNFSCTSNTLFYTIQTASGEYFLDLAFADLLPFRIQREKRVSNP